MNEPEFRSPPNSDNPVKHTFDNLMKGGGRSRALERLLPGDMWETGTVGHLLHKTDKFNVSSQMKRAHYVGQGEKVGELLKSHKSLVFGSDTFDMMSNYLREEYGAGMKGLQGFSTRIKGIKDIRFMLGTAESIGNLPAQRTLFYGVGSDVSSYKPLMVGRGSGGLLSGVVTMGSVKMAPGTTRMQRGVRLDKSMTEEFYSQLASHGHGTQTTSLPKGHEYYEAHQEFLNRRNKFTSLAQAQKAVGDVYESIPLSGKRVMKELMQPRPFIRGEAQTLTELLSMQKNVIVTDSLTEMAGDLAAFRRAATDIRFAQRTGEVSKLRSAQQSYERYAGQLIKHFNKLGVPDALSLIKPEHLIGAEDTALLAPTKLLTDILGTAHTETMARKGVFQRFKRTILSGDQVENVNKLRGRGFYPHAAYKTQSAYGALQEISGAMFDEVSMRTLFVRSSDPVVKALNLGDSGGILTPIGQKALKSQRYVGKISLAGWNDETIRALRQAFPGLELDKRMLAAMGEQHVYRVNLPVALDQKALQRAKGFKSKGGWLQGPLVKRDAALRHLMQRSQQSKAIWKALTGMGATGGAMLREISLNDDSIVMHFGTEAIQESRFESIVMNDRRLSLVGQTLVSPRQQTARKLSSVGIGAIVAMEDVASMNPRKLFLENYFATARQFMMGDAQLAVLHGIDPAMAKSVGNTMMARAALGTEDIPFHKKMRGMAVAIVDNEFAAMERAHLYMDELRGSKVASMRKLADNLTHGVLITSKMVGDTRSASEIGFSGGRMFITGVSMRPDFGLDINPGSMLNMKLQKLGLVGSGSRILGYADPNADPLFRSLNARMANQVQRRLNLGAGIAGATPSMVDELTGDFKLPGTLRNFLNWVKNPSGTLGKGTMTYGLRGGKLGLTHAGGFMELNPIPDSSRFGFAEGVLEKDVKGSILDKTNKELRNLLRDNKLFLDLGSETRFELAASNSATAYGGSSKYAPLPLSLARVESNQAGQYMLSTGSTPREVVNLLGMVQGGATPGALGKQYNTTLRGIVKGIMGKEGLFNSMTQMSVHGLAATPVSSMGPQRTMSSKDMYTVRIADNDLKGYLKVLEGQPGGDKLARAVQQQIRQKGFAYAAIGADPAQRPEHIQMVRLEKIKSKLSRGSHFVAMGHAAVDVHPALMWMLERDNDKDVVRLLLTKEMTENADLWDDRIGRQALQSKAAMTIIDYEMRGGARARGPAQLIRDVMTPGSWKGLSAEDVAVYLGTKAEADIGYTITRPVDFMKSLVSQKSYGEAKEAMARLGVKNLDFIEPEARSLLRHFSDPKKAELAKSLAQALYQGGVAKGKEKNALRELAAVLAETQQGASSNRLSSFLQKDSKLENAFFNFLQSQEKTRYITAGSELVQSAISDARAASNEGLVGLLEGLERGERLNRASYTTVRETLDRQAARLLTSFYGAGYWLRGRDSSFQQARTVESITHYGSASQIDAMLEGNPENIVKKLFQPALGADETYSERTVGAGSTYKASEEAVDTLRSRLGKMFQGRAGLIWGGVGAAVGGYMAARMTSPVYNEAPLPPDPLLGQPDDVGPQVPTRYSRSVKIPMNHPAPISRGVGQVRHREVPNLNSAFVGANINIGATTNYGDSYTMRRKMRDIANSDYVR